MKKNRMESLVSFGFQVEEAMRYCANDEEIYQTVLRTAYDEGMEKIPLLKSCVEQRDFTRYGIEVHGIKSTARTIGAVSLYELSEKQNRLVKAGQEEAAFAGNDELMEVYQKTLENIRQVL